MSEPGRFWHPQVRDAFRRAVEEASYESHRRQPSVTE
jgi:hypothetical protein